MRHFKFTWQAARSAWQHDGTGAAVCDWDHADRESFAKVKAAAVGAVIARSLSIGHDELDPSQFEVLFDLTTYGARTDAPKHVPSPARR